MYRDKQTVLSESQALTVTALSTNAYDLGAAAIASGPTSDPGIGQPLSIIVTVPVAAKVSVTDETYEFDIVQADDAALSVNLNTIAQYAFTNARAGTVLKLGAILGLNVPAFAITREFLGLKYILAGTGPTITVISWISLSSMVQMQRYYGSKLVVL